MHANACPTRVMILALAFSAGCNAARSTSDGAAAPTTSALTAAGADFYYIGPPEGAWENTQNWSRTRGGLPVGPPGVYPNAEGHNAYVVTPPSPKSIAVIRELITVAKLNCNADDPTGAVRVHNARLTIRRALDVGNDAPRNGKTQHGTIELAGDAAHKGQIIVWEQSNPAVAIGGRGNGELFMKGNCEFACQGNIQLGADSPAPGAQVRGHIKQLGGLLLILHNGESKSLFIGHHAHTHGTYELQGGELKVVGNVNAGYTGAGDLLISGGAKLNIKATYPQDGFLFIANSTDSTGVVQVDGDNVHVSVEHGIFVGGDRGAAGGTGQLLLKQNAGSPTIHSGVVVWSTGTLKGDGTITDDVGNHGIIEADHDFNSPNPADRIGSLHFLKQLKNEPTGRIIISIDPAGNCDQLFVGTNFSANGTIEIRYTGAPPPPGMCQIIHASPGSITDHGVKFVFPPGENWDTSAFKSGVITHQ